MEKGTCPVCSGSGRVPAGDNQYKNVLAGYDKESDTLACQNCGGQYMWGRPSGKVSMDFGGQPCVHEYDGKNVGRCLTEYTCKFCGDRHQIDSGD
jgi:hypothetical protein